MSTERKYEVDGRMCITPCPIFEGRMIGSDSCTGNLPLNFAYNICPHSGGRKVKTKTGGVVLCRGEKV